MTEPDGLTAQAVFDALKEILDCTFIKTDKINPDGNHGVMYKVRLDTIRDIITSLHSHHGVAEAAERIMQRYTSIMVVAVDPITTAAQAARAEFEDKLRMYLSMLHPAPERTRA